MEKRMPDQEQPLAVDSRPAGERVPGGLFSCRLDRLYTLIQVNEGFLTMLGYTEEELSLLFHKSFWNMVDPRDRADLPGRICGQAGQSAEIELEYRVLHRDGGVVWVLSRGHVVRGADGGEYFCCMLVDITRHKDLERTLRMSLERHQIIIDQTTDIIFEWDIVADTFDFSPNWELKFGTTPVTRNVSLFLNEAPHIYPKDRSLFANLAERIMRGERYVEAELRFMCGGDEHLWCRVRITGLADETGRTVRAVGAIVDVDAEKRHALSLLESAQRDVLTKLYNKGASFDLIHACLSHAMPGSQSAMIIIDLDNFKQTNDTMGHLFGDALLVEAARTLQKQFRSQDIVGRIGGDEFIVFLNQIPDAQLALDKAAKTLRAMGEMAVRERANVTLSCSIGVAMSPACGTTYNELFQKADQALYQAKSQGKNRLCLFDPEAAPSGFPYQPHSAVGARIDSDEEPNHNLFSSNLVENVFHQLYKSVDVDAAINSILAIVGRRFDVSRAYIFENSEDNLLCSNTFEWCNDGVSPEIHNLRAVSYAEQLEGSYTKNFNEGGIFYCRDIESLPPMQYEILAPQGIKSILQCGIYDNGVFRGYVGFDECRTNRFWTQEQVDALTFISQILSIFLLKQRAHERAVQNGMAMESILDSQSSWIYTIRPKTYEMLYINRKTRELVPDAKLGMRCYEAYYNRTAPCTFCPADGLSDACSHCTKEIYNPVLDVWTSTDADYLNWEGEGAVLLTCHDITDLKRELEQAKKQR